MEGQKKSSASLLTCTLCVYVWFLGPWLHLPRKWDRLNLSIPFAPIVILSHSMQMHHLELVCARRHAFSRQLRHQERKDIRWHSMLLDVHGTAQQQWTTDIVVQYILFIPCTRNHFLSLLFTLCCLFFWAPHARIAAIRITVQTEYWLCWIEFTSGAHEH
jgi:hypothetical protein